MDQADDYGFLPDVLRQMAEKFGLGVALTFAAEFGGKRLYIPKKAWDDHQIAKVVGRNVLEWLISEYRCSVELTVPLVQNSAYNRRIGEIRQMLRSGLSTSTIIANVRCHERTIRRHRKYMREKNVADRQGNLFERSE